MLRILFGMLIVFAAFAAGCGNENLTGVAGTTGLNASGAVQIVDVGTQGSGVNTQPLVAGQSIAAGVIAYDDVDTDGDGVVDALSICYRTQDGWELVETHFFVGASLAEMPANRSGNPQIGLFPYKSGPITGQTEYCFTIPFTAIGFACPGPEDYFVAAHAAVRKLLPGGGYQNETGWGDGQRLVQRGNWAMYNRIFITCDQLPPPSVNTTCETAFAFDGDQAGCFQNFSEFIANENRWGWTNGPFAPGTYTLDIYAAAGQCDISKGTWVGTLSVNYANGTAVVTYTIAGTDAITHAPYTLKEAHLYVGSELFPRDNQGNFTIASGQYPYKASLPDGTTTWTQTITGLSGSIYVIAHGVVCGFPK